MSSDTINPFRNSEQWDKLEVAGVVSPGICEVTGFKRVHSWEVKKGKGVKGSTTTLNEFPPCEGTVTFLLWTEDHFSEWGTFRELFKYDPTKKTVNAVDIYYPSLADIECFKVVCKEIGAIERASKGLYKVSVSLLEYNPPPKKPAVATPGGSQDKAKGSGASKTEPTALDARQQEIDRLLKQAREP